MSCCYNRVSALTAATAVVALVIALLATKGDAETILRPPAIPLITTDPFMQTWVRGDTINSSVVHWDGTSKQMCGLLRVNGTAYLFLGTCATSIVADNGTASTSILTSSNSDPLPSLEQIHMDITPTQSIFSFALGDALKLDLAFVSTLLPNNYVLLSRPISYVSINVTVLDNSQHKVEVFFDMTADHAVNKPVQEVAWAPFSSPTGSVKGNRLGTSAQDVLGSKGDGVNIDWGYLYLSAIGSGSDSSVSTYAGSCNLARSSFATQGMLPSKPDTRQPRQAGDDCPALSVAKSMGPLSKKTNGGKAMSFTALVGYDEVEAVYYFGSKYKGYWTQTYDSIEQALEKAADDFQSSRELCNSHDQTIAQATAAKGGPGYSAICALAHRQTLAALKQVWNHDLGVRWTFLKEISTNGDMQTMDVIFPASPMLLYTNRDILKTLLVPVLKYANNETWLNFTNPFSPHQLGTYPIANATTKQQEPMPMENTGNMFLMLAAIVLGDPQHDASFFYPHYWPMLRSWADYLQATLPFPANQLCTDDFTGRLANNTNLAAKGIVALQAFSALCQQVGDSGCDGYSKAAKNFSQVWQHYAVESEPKPHFKIAYNYSDSWSLKYNLVWQKLLNMSAPFDWATVAGEEVSYYLAQQNQYGTPLDLRHTYVKLDWLSWVAVMASDDATFHKIFDPIVEFANTTTTRVPLTDLYDTVTGDATHTTSFIARPVVGGVFAKMLVD